MSSYFARREWDDDVHISVPRARYSPRRILSLPRTGMGCLSEEEVVVVGGLDGASVTSVDGLRQTLGMSYDEAALWVRDRENARAMPSDLIAKPHRTP